MNDSMPPAPVPPQMPPSKRMSLPMIGLLLLSESCPILDMPVPVTLMGRTSGGSVSPAPPSGAIPAVPAPAAPLPAVPAPAVPAPALPLVAPAVPVAPPVPAVTAPAEPVLPAVPSTPTFPAAPAFVLPAVPEPEPPAVPAVVAPAVPLLVTSGLVVLPSQAPNSSKEVTANRRKTGGRDVMDRRLSRPSSGVRAKETRHLHPIFGGLTQRGAAARARTDRCPRTAGLSGRVRRRAGGQVCERTGFGAWHARCFGGSAQTHCRKIDHERN